MDWTGRSRSHTQIITSKVTHMQTLALSSTFLSVFYMPLQQNQTQHTHTHTHTHKCILARLGPTSSQDDINSDNVPSAQWILELLTMPSARLDPIIKVSSKETNWISAGMCNWKLAFNDALWPRAEPSVDINQTSPRQGRLDRVVHCSVNTIRGIRFIWS